MYEIRYLPIARQDLLNIVSYMKDNLHAPKAAADFIDSFDIAVQRLEQFPYSCQIYSPPQELKNEYRMLHVNNYAVMYSIKGNIVEIYRVIYARMDITQIIE